jgi:hypothetical protein
MLYKIPRTAVIVSSLSDAYDWYVDSVFGNDGNSGKSPAQAFQTIAQLSVAGFGSGESVGLARGSHWRESLTLPGVNHTVEAYGSGARPILDGSDVIAGGSWIKTGGRTNVYEYTASVPTAGANNFFNVFENDIQCTWYADLASLDAAVTLPGMYIANIATLTPTLYIHASGVDKNPATNGKTYEASLRPYGIYGTDREFISGIQVMRGYQKDGTLAVRDDCSIYNCLVQDAAQYGIFTGEGSEVAGCTVINGHHGTSSSIIQILYNRNAPTGRGVTIRNCDLGWDSATAPRIGVAVIVSGHNNVSGSFGALVFEDNQVDYTSWVFQDPRHLSSILSARNTIERCQYFLVTPSATGTGAAIPITSQDDTISSCFANARIASAGALAQISIDNLTATLTNSMSSAYFYVTDGSLTITDSDINVTQVVASGFPMLRATTASAVLSLQRNEFYLAEPFSYFYTIDAGAVGLVWDSDYNEFDYTTNCRWQYLGATVVGLANWQTTTSQDANSTAV